MRIPQVKGHMAALAAFSEQMCGPEHVRCFGGSRLRRVVSVLSVPASLQCSILLKLQLHRQNDRAAWSYSESTEELQFRVVLCKVRHGKCVGPSWNMVRAFSVLEVKAPVADDPPDQRQISGSGSFSVHVTMDTSLPRCSVNPPLDLADSRVANGMCPLLGQNSPRWILFVL